MEPILYLCMMDALYKESHDISFYRYLGTIWQATNSLRKANTKYQEHCNR